MPLELRSSSSLGFSVAAKKEQPLIYTISSCLHSQEHLLFIFPGILLFQPKGCNTAFHSSPSGLVFTMEVFMGDPPRRGTAQVSSHISVTWFSRWIQGGNRSVLIVAGVSSLYHRRTRNSPHLSRRLGFQNSQSSAHKLLTIFLQWTASSSPASPMMSNPQDHSIGGEGSSLDRPPV